MNKQNSLITRYCLAVVAIVALLGPLAQNGRGDFVLWYDEQITVNSHHNQGILYDTSRAFIVSGGSVHNLYAYNYSDVNISGGSVDYLYPYDSSTVNFSSGSITKPLYAYDSSTVNFSGGNVNGGLSACDSSTVNFSGGYVSGLYSSGSSVVDFSGGSVDYLQASISSVVDISGGSVSNIEAYDSSTANISGGSVSNLKAYNSSTIIFHGRGFRASGSLVLDGERVLGTGILSGEWMDGTRWVVNIAQNPSTATILAILNSEPKPVCVKHPRMDFSGDCKVDFADFAIMASSWLECNLVPQSACWE
jgi:hypothetical protein